MPIRKIAEIKVTAGPYGRSEAVGSGFKFYSYDKDSAAIDFYFRNQDISPTDILGCTTELVLLTKEDGQQKKLTIIDSEVEIISALKGHARYVIPDRLRGYVGLVQGYVYLNFPDESRTDECRFDFTIERSLIEEEFENGGDYYIKDIQVIFDEVKDTLNSKIPEMQTKYDDLVKTFTDYANEKIAEYDSRFVTLNSNFLTLQDSLTTAQNKVTTLEQSIATANTNLNTRINEINKKIDDNDVFTKAESSANVVSQLGGAESAILKKEMLVDGFEGTGSRDNNGTLVPFSAEDYASLLSIDGIVRTETTVAGRGAEMQFDFKVIETLESKYPFIFEGLTTVAEKIAKYKTLVKSASFDYVSRGGGVARKYSRAYCIDNGLPYVLGSPNTKDTFELLECVLGSYVNRMQVDGIYRFAVVSKKNDTTQDGAISDGTTPAWVEVKDVRLIIELEVNGRTIIEEIIANDRVENVTKNSIGLGNVENYGVATQAEAEAGAATNKYMTPARVFQSISSWVKGKFVSTTGNETILGTKNFQDGIQVSGKNPVLTKPTLDKAYIDKNNNASVVADGTMKLYRRGDTVFLTGSIKLSAAKYNQAVWFDVPSWAAPIDMLRMYWSSGGNLYLLTFDPSTINNIICIDNVAQGTWLTGSFCWLARDPY